MQTVQLHDNFPKTHTQHSFKSSKQIDEKGDIFCQLYHCILVHFMVCKSHKEISILYRVLQEKFDLGELMMSLCYLPTAGRLTLTIVKARNLKAMDITGASGNNNSIHYENMFMQDIEIFFSSKN